MMTWHTPVYDWNAGTALSRRFETILEQLESGDYVGASDAMRHWADESELETLSDDLMDRLRACVMDARAELIHLEPDAARACIRHALAIAGAL